MSMEKDLNDIAGDGPNWFRYLVLGALLSGAGSGLVGITKDTSDRYKGSDAKEDFAHRDREIEKLQQLMQLHLQHSATYSDRIDRYGVRLNELEKELNAHLRALKDHD
jgi:hypothetical protein